MEIKVKDLIIVGLIAFTIFSQFKSCSNKSNYKSDIEAILDSNRTFIKDGLEYTESKVIEMNKKDFTTIKNLTGEVKRLQELVKNTPRIVSATVLANETNSKIVTDIDTIISNDNIILDDTVYIYPEYHYTFEDKWKFGQIQANKDSVNLNLMTLNEFDIVVQKEKWKITKPFKKREALLTVKNLNPNTYTTHLKTFSVDCGHKPWRDRLIGGVAGIGLGLYLSK